MTNEQRLQLLRTPTHPVDVVLDTDTYNEIDDQFALSYLLANSEKLHLKAIYAAPFSNHKADNPKLGMELSYEEIGSILAKAGKTEYAAVAFRGSECYLPDEKTPVDSPAARHLADLAMHYTTDDPLYIVAIGAITNVASAFLLRPEIAEKTVLVWLGGHAHHWQDNGEFNCRQDVAAARVVFSCGVPLVQLPCFGIVDHFMIPYTELEYHLGGKGPLCDYLTDTVRDELSRYCRITTGSRVIWDVTAVAWLLNDNDRFLWTHVVKTPVPEYDHHYSFPEGTLPMAYVCHINRDALAHDLFEKIIRLDAEKCK